MTDRICMFKQTNGNTSTGKKRLILMNSSEQPFVRNQKHVPTARETL